MGGESRATLRRPPPGLAPVCFLSGHGCDSVNRLRPFGPVVVRWRAPVGGVLDADSFFVFLILVVYFRGIHGRLLVLLAFRSPEALGWMVTGLSVGVAPCVPRLVASWHVQFPG